MLSRTSRNSPRLCAVPGEKVSIQVELCANFPWNPITYLAPYCWGLGQQEVLGATWPLSVSWNWSKVLSGELHTKHACAQMHIVKRWGSPAVLHAFCIQFHTCYTANGDIARCWYRSWSLPGETRMEVSAPSGDSASDATSGGPFNAGRTGTVFASIHKQRRAWWIESWCK